MKQKIRLSNPKLSAVFVSGPGGNLVYSHSEYGVSLPRGDGRHFYVVIARVR